MKGLGATSSLEDFVIHVLLPIGVIVIIIAMAVLMLQQYGINVQIPNPFS